MGRRKIVSKVIMMSIALMISSAIVVMGGKGARAETSGGFSIQAIIPENQIDTRQTYFDLGIKAGEEQRIEIVVNNSRDEELAVDIRLNPASTGRNGLIVYTEPDVRDTLMKVSITDVAILEEESIKVPARGSRRVGIQIKMPEETIEGVILGGISVSGNDGEYERAGNEGITLRNKITYVVALKINGSEVGADFDLRSITPELINYKTAVVATLENRAARIVKGMEVRALIYQKGSNEVLRELIREEAEMAPLSSGEFVIDWENQAIKQGDYRLRMTAEYEGKTWEWEREFGIGGEANEINKEAKGITTDKTWMYVALGGVVLTIICLVAYRIGRGRRKNEGLSS